MTASPISRLSSRSMASREAPDSGRKPGDRPDEPSHSVDPRATTRRQEERGGKP